MSMNRYRGGWGEWGPGAMWLLVIGSYVVLGQSTSWHFLWEQVVCLDPNPTPTHDTRALGAMKWQSPCPSPGRHPRRVFSDGGGDEQLVLAGTAGADPRRRRGSDLAERGAISVQVPDFLRIDHPGRSCAARSEDRRSTRSLPSLAAGDSSVCARGIALIDDLVAATPLLFRRTRLAGKSGRAARPFVTAKDGVRAGLARQSAYPRR